ncbi:MAG: DUF3300 domain-containing protein [Pseudolabrys sp.]|jgi:hypothetical protein
MILVPVAANAQTPATSASTSSDQLLKELDALVAPIALYPDTLLSLVLMASTYPLEVIQAERWVRENKLKGYCEFRRGRRFRNAVQQFATHRAGGRPSGPGSKWTAARAE